MLPRVQSRISDHLGARAQYIWTRQFGQHYASQSLTNAADAQQKIAFRLKVAIIVDRQCDGFVDRSELAREVRDRRIGQGLASASTMPLFLRFFHSVRPAMMPDRIVCNSPNRRWVSEGGAHPRSRHRCVACRKGAPFRWLAANKKERTGAGHSPHPLGSNATVRFVAGPPGGHHEDSQ